MADKTCRRCGKSRPLTDFGKKTSKPDGHDIYCRDCNREKCREFWKNMSQDYKRGRNALNRHLKTRYSQLKHHARRQEWELTLTIEQYGDILMRGECHYCGGGLPVTGIGLDRKDSSVGYSVDNVVPCCWKCNVAKGADITYDDFVKHIAPGLRAWRKGA